MKPTSLLLVSSFAALAFGQSQSSSDFDYLIGESNNLLRWSLHNSTVGAVCGLSAPLSHIVGVLQPPATELKTGPDSGKPANPGSNTWTLDVPYSPVPDTLFLLLHFTEVSLPGGNQLQINLGYEIE